ncbi:MAG: B12-binding domain-containing radical SAM protein, partial [Arenicella sp.]|nr:B12-binding domain-containing radical SAM protein [Arenicella sp.]
MPTNAFPQRDIVLTTLNARYIHSAFGLRYLQANLHKLQARSVICEYTLESKTEDIAEQLLAHRPKIIGIGVYIWNATQSERLVALLKVLAPEVIIVLGGPEVSYEYKDQAIVNLANHVISGWGELSFYQLVNRLLKGESPGEKVIVGEQPLLSKIKMPYALYNDEDISHRVVYVEASRGCPFKCEFCLSALDKTAWPFDLELFLQEMDDLYRRGARHFKFVDRTFNLKIKNSLRILQFFLDRMDSELFLHFEVIPDHLPEPLKAMIKKFPPASLQFEIGIQTLNTDVQRLISRRQDNEKACENISWIVQNSNAHVHTDLIFGLPGETMLSFADGFNKVVALRPHEIQVGILKRLKGSPIARHTVAYQLKFNPNPPFNILSSNTFSYLQVQDMNRFARYWDLIGNSGHFKISLPLLLNEDPFNNFAKISAALYRRTSRTHKISLLRL